MGSQFSTLILWRKNFITFFKTDYTSILSHKHNRTLEK